MRHDAQGNPITAASAEAVAAFDSVITGYLGSQQTILAIESGAMDKSNNAIKNAPHTASAIAADKWDHPYTREHAAFPAAWTREHKYWPSVGRIDNVYGDRNLVCACS